RVADQEQQCDDDEPAHSGAGRDGPAAHEHRAFVRRLLTDDREAEERGEDREQHVALVELDAEKLRRANEHRGRDQRRRQGLERRNQYQEQGDLVVAAGQAVVSARVIVPTPYAIDMPAVGTCRRATFSARVFFRNCKNRATPSLGSYSGSNPCRRPATVSPIAHAWHESCSTRSRPMRT